MRSRTRISLAFWTFNAIIAAAVIVAALR